jgi:hypothetical protein
MEARDDSAERRQTYLDESLRIAVWEMIFGSGSRDVLDELLAAGARWQPDPSDPGDRSRAAR